ncbi:MAG: ribonuclease P protein component [Treponemataceae bacterium]|nr:ribonuclease P protein component [Treponemataceae bacterium]
MSETGCFTRSERVKRSDEIQILFKKGQKVGVKGAKLFFMQNGKDFNRIAFALPRGYGNAVERNKAKRLSREAYRLFKTHLNTGYDMVFLVYPGNDSFPSRCEAFRQLCLKAGLVRT